MEKSLLFTGKLYLNIKPQDMRKNIRSAQQNNTLKKRLPFNIHSSFGRKRRREDVNYVLRAQPGFFPSFLTAYKNLFPQGHFPIKPP